MPQRGITVDLSTRFFARSPEILLPRREIRLEPSCHVFPVSDGPPHGLGAPVRAAAADWCLPPGLDVDVTLFDMAICDVVCFFGFVGSVEDHQRAPRSSPLAFRDGYRRLRRLFGGLVVRCRVSGWERRLLWEKTRIEGVGQLLDQSDRHFPRPG